MKILFVLAFLFAGFVLLTADANDHACEDSELYKQIKVGMTREAVERYCYPDGGLSSPFRLERYVLNHASGSVLAGGEVQKVNCVFKPAGMSDAVFYLAKFVAPKISSKDLLMKISAPFKQKPFHD